MKHDFVPGDNHILCSKCGYGRYDSNHYIISMPQEQTFEEWWETYRPNQLNYYGKTAARAAWNAAKGVK